MTKLLKRTVLVDGVPYRPGVPVPTEIAARIRNPKAWVDGDASAAPAVGAVPEPVQTREAGKPLDGTETVKELKGVAKEHGVVLGEARTKDAILAALAEAGVVPVSAEPDTAGAESDVDPEDVAPAADADPVDVDPAEDVAEGDALEVGADD
ncbi:hypothetical protein ACXET9_07265 [Brachybacterium sp. DNPG3]